MTTVGSPINQSESLLLEIQNHILQKLLKVSQKFIPLQQLHGMVHSQILISGVYLPNSHLIIFQRLISQSRGRTEQEGDRVQEIFFTYEPLNRTINNENIFFRLSADYKVRNAKTCSSENADALSTKQVRYDSHKYDIGSIIEMYEYRTIRQSISPLLFYSQPPYPSMDVTKFDFHQ